MNAYDPKDTPLPTETVIKESHQEKAYEPMDISEYRELRFNNEKEPQPEKAYEPMDTRDPGKSMDANDRQEQNALSPIDWSPAGNSMLVKAVHP